jgi:hypothetical protein
MCPANGQDVKGLDWYLNKGWESGKKLFLKKQETVSKDFRR